MQQKSLRKKEKKNKSWIQVILYVAVENQIV